MIVPVPVVIPQGLKPSVYAPFTAPLKPCPCYKTDFRNRLSMSLRKFVYEVLGRFSNEVIPSSFA